MRPKRNGPADEGEAGVQLGGEHPAHSEIAAQEQISRQLMLQGERRDGSIIFAAVDPSARYTSPQVCRFRFSAMLAPYASEDAARDALCVAGAEIIIGELQ